MAIQVNLDRVANMTPRSPLSTAWVTALVEHMRD